MPGYRKLGRASDQRKALLRNQVTNLLWHGRIETTEARARKSENSRKAYNPLQSGNTIKPRR